MGAKEQGRAGMRVQGGSRERYPRLLGRSAEPCRAARAQKGFPASLRISYPAEDAMPVCPAWHGYGTYRTKRLRSARASNLDLSFDAWRPRCPAPPRRACVPGCRTCRRPACRACTATASRRWGIWPTRSPRWRSVQRCRGWPCTGARRGWAGWAAEMAVVVAIMALPWCTQLAKRSARQRAAGVQTDFVFVFWGWQGWLWGSGTLCAR
jgi:hypothetical protein